MRTVLVFLTLITMTPFFGLMVIIAALVGVKDAEGSIYDNAPRWWARCLVSAAGIRLRLHNEERMRGSYDLAVGPGYASGTINITGQQDSTLAGDAIVVIPG